MKKADEIRYIEARGVLEHMAKCLGYEIKELKLSPASIEKLKRLWFVKSSEDYRALANEFHTHKQAIYKQKHTENEGLA